MPAFRPHFPAYPNGGFGFWRLGLPVPGLARNEFAGKVLGLPPASFAEPIHASHPKGFPVLYGFSPSVIPAPANWGADDHVTGNWFLNSAGDWTPRPALLDFLQAGSPPVYVGFGSMSSRNPEETTDLVLKALALPLRHNSVSIWATYCYGLPGTGSTPVFAAQIIYSSV